MRPELIEDCGLLCHLLLVQEVGLEIVDLLNLGVNRRWLSRDEPEGRYYDKGAEHNLGFPALFYTPEIPAAWIFGNYRKRMDNRHDEPRKSMRQKFSAIQSHPKNENRVSASTAITSARSKLLAPMVTLPWKAL